MGYTNVKKNFRHQTSENVPLFHMRARSIPMTTHAVLDDEDSFPFLFFETEFHYAVQAALQLTL